MRKMRTTIGIVIDTLGSIIIYAVIALAILFMAGQAGDRVGDPFHGRSGQTLL